MVPPSILNIQGMCLSPIVGALGVKKGPTKAHSNIGMYQNVIWATKCFDAYMTSIDATFEIELRQIIKSKI